MPGYHRFGWWGISMILQACSFWVVLLYVVIIAIIS
jgi:hypothetical protein